MDLQNYFIEDGGTQSRIKVEEKDYLVHQVLDANTTVKETTVPFSLASASGALATKPKITPYLNVSGEESLISASGMGLEGTITAGSAITSIPIIPSNETYAFTQKPRVLSLQEACERMSTLVDEYETKWDRFLEEEHKLFNFSDEE